jgi:hypothetical protein
MWKPERNWTCNTYGDMRNVWNNSLIFVAISPLRPIRRRWEGYIKTYIKEIRRKAVAQDSPVTGPCQHGSTMAGSFVTSGAKEQVWSVWSYECYATSERHSSAPGHWGQVESCGPVAEQTDFTARWKPTLLWCQQACSIPKFGYILYGSSHWNIWNEFYSGPTYPHVTEAQFPPCQLPYRWLSAQNFGT